MLLSLLLWFVAMTQSRRIVRAEASLLLAIYLVYLTWRTLFEPS